VTEKAKHTTTNKQHTIGVLGGDKSGDGGFSDVIVGDESLEWEPLREIAASGTSDLKLTHVREL
jgi:hypothetical protein